LGSWHIVTIHNCIHATDDNRPLISDLLPSPAWPSRTNE
jgi:hypothetical protein